MLTLIIADEIATTTTSIHCLAQVHFELVATSHLPEPGFLSMSSEFGMLSSYLTTESLPLYLRTPHVWPQ